MPAERTRKEAYHTPHTSSPTDHHSPQARGRYDQHYPRSPEYGSEETSNRWPSSPASSSRSTTSPATSWRYPPLPFDSPGSNVPGINGSIRSYEVASQPAPTASASRSASGRYRYYPLPEGSASPEERRDMRVMDEPSEARTITVSSQWGRSTSLSPINTLDGPPPPPRLPITPLRTGGNSGHEAENIGNVTGGNVKTHPPWLRSRAHEMDPNVPSIDIRNRTAPVPPSMITSHLMVSPLDETIFNPFKLLESINYIDVDRRPKKQPSLELGRFFMNTGRVKQEIADSLTNEFDEYCRSKKPMQPSAKFFIRTEAAVLGRAVFHSKETTLHILTDLDGLIMCPYHTDIVKDYKIKGISDSRRGTRIDPKVQREPGKLHCGCPEDDVILEMMLRKLTVFPAEIGGQMSTMRGDFLSPRERSFVCSLFRNWSGLNTKDMFKFDDDGRVRTYEDLLKAQIAGLQNRLAWVEATGRHQDGRGRS